MKKKIETEEEKLKRATKKSKQYIDNSQFLVAMTLKITKKIIKIRRWARKIRR